MGIKTVKAEVNECKVNARFEVKGQVPDDLIVQLDRSYGAGSTYLAAEIRGMADGLSISGESVGNGVRPRLTVSWVGCNDPQRYSGGPVKGTLEAQTNPCN